MIRAYDTITKGNDIMNTMVISIIIMVLCIALFITEKIPYATAGFLGLILLVVFKVCTFGNAFGQFAGETVFTVLGMGIVGSGLDHSGLIEIVGGRIVKLAGNSERKLLIVCVALAAILSAFMNNQTVVVLVVTLAAGICKKFPGIKMRDLAMPIAFATVFGGQFTLIGTSSQLVGSGILEDYTGKGFGMWTISPVGITVGLVCCILMCTLGLSFGKRIWGKKEEAVGLDQLQIEERVYDKKKQIIMASIMVFLIVILVTEVVSVGTGAMIGAVLTIILGGIDQKTALKETNWNILLWLGCILGLPRGLQETGASEFIARWVLSKLDLIGAPMFSFTVIIVFTCVLTHLIANSTCVAIILPIVLEMAAIAGFNPMPFAVGVTVMCAMAIATPLGAGFVAYVMVCGYKFSDFLKYGAPFAVVSCIAIIISTPIFFPFAG